MAYPNFPSALLISHGEVVAIPSPPYSLDYVQIYLCTETHSTDSSDSYHGDESINSQLFDQSELNGMVSDVRSGKGID